MNIMSGFLGIKASPITSVKRFFFLSLFLIIWLFYNIVLSAYLSRYLFIRLLASLSFCLFICFSVCFLFSFYFSFLTWDIFVLDNYIICWHIWCNRKNERQIGDASLSRLSEYWDLLFIPWFVACWYS